MNRRMIYTGALPQDLDVNQNAQFAMISDGFSIESVMGGSAFAYGLVGTQTTSPSLTINIGRGALGQMAVVDATNPGSSGIADATDALMKVGINLAATQLTFVAPTTAGQSQVFLIQGKMSEADGSAVVQPYYNAGNPAAPFSGPNNSGAASNTLRAQTVALSVVAGSPAATGSQTTPAVAAGNVPLYTVTLANGQTTISTAQIVQHPAAPFLPFSLPQLAPGFSRMVAFSATGTFTVPLGVTRLKVRMWGGGGGGGGTTGTSSAGAGGGGGGYTEGVFSGLVPGTVYAATVGAGGVGGSGAVAGTTGGTTSLGALMSATGGGGGAGASGAIATPSGTGGLGIGGAINFAGYGGGTGVIAGASLSSGLGGAAFQSTGAGVSSSSSSVAQSGNGGGLPGAGAGGGVSGGAGGTGAAGLIIVEY